MYPFEIIVSVNQTDIELNNVLKRKGIEDRYLAEYGSKNGIGKYVLWVDESYGLIRIKNLPRTAQDYSVLIHEVLHIVISVLRAVGMKIDNEMGSDEAYTYLMSFLVKKIFTKLNAFY